MQTRSKLPIRSALIAAMLLVAISGCSSLSSPGSMFSSGSHKLLPSAARLRNAASEPAGLPRELERDVLPAYIVEPGDVLLVQPSDLDSPVRLPSDQPVLPDGNIELGRYGRLRVAGKSVEGVEAEVQAIIRRETKDAGPITVRLIGRQSKVFYVLGEVNAPGAYPLSGRETVLDAIVAAGGLTDQANQSRITYSQPTPPESCRVVLPVCYRDIVQLGDTSTNYQLKPGDRVYVPSRTFCEQLQQSLSRDAGRECPPCGRCQTGCYAGPPPVEVVHSPL